MRVYCIDASSLIDWGVRFQPRNIAEPLWLRLEDLIRMERMITVHQVVLELDGRKSDGMAKWARSQTTRWIRSVDAELVQTVTSLMRDYPDLVRQDVKFGADPYLVAWAERIGRGSPSGTLQVFEDEATDPHEPTLVTEERPKAGKVNIPFVCGRRGLACINLERLLELERWSFGENPELAPDNL
ncbi:MAG TPA: DUF4411 family protein [Candidatus Dormibacteraeota bacterium]|nr:DUF4411 family protein [Candidatus Dormibacteraeota bacterium]